jgi:hypothetical protein
MESAETRAEGGSMSEWISVEDQEAPADTKILVYGTQYGGTYEFMSVCKISQFTRKADGKVFKYVDIPEVSGYDTEIDFKPEEITHWMPLPEAPK